MKKVFSVLGNVLFVIILIALVAVMYFFYKKYYFNDFMKAQYEDSEVNFYRDTDERTTSDASFCINNTDYNDSVFYKSLSLEKNTSYRVTCKVKTSDVEVISKTDQNDESRI